LLSPNLYTPPIFGITVADTVPSITSYAVTFGTPSAGSSGLSGQINEAYVYTSGGNLNVYTGKKIGDLTLKWVSQEQGNVQILGYIEGSPPCPMANLTVKSSYAGATSLSLTATSNVVFKYSSDMDYSTESKWDISDATGVGIGLQTMVAPFGIGIALSDKMVMALNLTLGVGGTFTNNDDNDDKETASATLVEADKFSVKLQGALAPITNDQFMASINTLSTASNTPGNPSAKTAILPNPNFGGFTSNNPPSAAPKTLPNDEKFGTRIFQPSPYGQAYVTSQVLDVFQQTLVQTNTVYGFVKIPNPNIPPDNNIVSFRMNSQYVKPGCLDGITGYDYNSATLPNGTQTYSTSTGQMNVLDDKNFDQSQIGNNASYMKIAEAYQLKKQIDLEAYNNIALYNTAYNAKAYPGTGLTNPVDFYNEYVWTSRGATEEIKHNYTTSYNEVYTVSNTSTDVINVNFNAKISCAAVTVCDLKLAYTNTSKFVTKYSIDQTLTNTFDMTVSLDGIENDTQMRNAANNDAHFILNNNSQFNVNNNSGLNLVTGSDGLVYNIVPSVQSGAGLPTSNNLDDAFSYTQPLPSYTSGSTTGLTGNLEPYDRPGKTKQFRANAYFLQPKQANHDVFWNTVIDPIWLANSLEADADAMRSAQANNSIPWRILYRVTYSERFLPPLSSGITPPPVITPLIAVPTLNATALKYSITHNNANAGVVLITPTTDGSDVTSSQNAYKFGNVLKFDTTSLNWGGSKNVKLLTSLLTSALGVQNTLKLSASYPSNSVKSSMQISDVKGRLVYTAYTDMNGLVYNISNLGSNLSVYIDVNGNPLQYTLDGKSFTAILANYLPSPDGTVMYYIQPPISKATSTPTQYDPTFYDLNGEYDPGNQNQLNPLVPQLDLTQEWTYYVVSGYSSNLTSSVGVTGQDPFMISGDYTDPITGVTTPGFSGFGIANTPSKVISGNGGYVICQTTLQYPHLNSNTEIIADINVYKSLSLFDLFSTGDVQILQNFTTALYPHAPFITGNETDIQLVLPRNVISYFNTLQQALLPQ